jgi:NADPH-dependent ferric siderophore reductase
VFGKGRSRRPAIVVRVVDESGADGVVQHVHDRPVQVSLRVDHPRGEPRAEQVASAPVSVVEPLRVLAVEVLDTRRELRLRRIEHEVDVVVHQAEGLAVPVIALDRCGEQAQIGEPIVVVAEDRGPVDAAGSHMEVAVR